MDRGARWVRPWGLKSVGRTGGVCVCVCVCVCVAGTMGAMRLDRFGRDHSRAASRDKSINYSLSTM